MPRICLPNHAAGTPLFDLRFAHRILFWAKSGTRTIDLLDGIANANYDAILWSKISENDHCRNFAGRDAGDSLPAQTQRFASVIRFFQSWWPCSSHFLLDASASLTNGNEATVVTSCRLVVSDVDKHNRICDVSGFQKLPVSVVKCDAMVRVQTIHLNTGDLVWIGVGHKPSNEQKGLQQTGRLSHSSMHLYGVDAAVQLADILVVSPQRPSSVLFP